MRSEFGLRGVLARETLEVPQGGRLVIGAWAGSVSVRAGDGSSLRIMVRSGGLLPPPVLEVERDGDAVYVAVRSAPLWRWLPAWAWRGVRLEVSVPPCFSVDVQARGGTVEIHGIDG